MPIRRQPGQKQESGPKSPTLSDIVAASIGKRVMPRAVERPDSRVQRGFAHRHDYGVPIKSPFGSFNKSYEYLVGCITQEQLGRGIEAFKVTLKASADGESHEKHVVEVGADKQPVDINSVTFHRNTEAILYFGKSNNADNVDGFRQELYIPSNDLKVPDKLVHSIEIGADDLPNGFINGEQTTQPFPIQQELHQHMQKHYGIDPAQFTVAAVEGLINGNRQD